MELRFEHVDKVMPDWFRCFLKENGLFEKYKHNINKLPAYDGDFPDNIPSDSNHRWVSSAFQWGKTDQGFDFWYDIHSKLTDEHPWNKITSDSKDDRGIIYNKLPEWFKKWLRDNGIATKYKDNMLNHPLTYVINVDNPIEFVYFAFEWADTPEGDDFWNDINDKYQEEKPWEQKEDNSEYVSHIKDVMPEWLRKWLEGKGVYDKYLANAGKDKGFDINFPDRIKDEDWIRLAFRWSSTPEGFAYWSKLNADCSEYKPWEAKPENINAEMAWKDCPFWFKDWLKKKGCFEKFRDSYLKYHSNDTLLPNTFKESNFGYIMDIAFCWRDTPEGAIFWKDLAETYKSEKPYLSYLPKRPDTCRPTPLSKTYLEKRIDEIAFPDYCIKTGTSSEGDNSLKPTLEPEKSISITL